MSSPDSKALPRGESHSLRDLEPFASVRLIALDLDGTLIEGTNPHVWENMRNDCARLRHARYNVPCTIATGRALAGARRFVEELGIPDSIPLVLYNGSLVLRLRDGEVLLRRSIEATFLAELLARPISDSITVFAYFARSTALRERQNMPLHESVLGWGKGRQAEHEFNGMRVTWQPKWEFLDSEGPIAILIQPNVSGSLTAAQKALSVDDRVSVVRGGDKYLEIRPAGSNKAIALQTVANSLGISRHEVLALGDSENDFEMLKWAGVPVAVAGSMAADLHIGSYQTTHGVASGAVEALRAVIAGHYYLAPWGTRRD